jgi:UDPglucose 6-dehydrogenase
MQIFEVGIIGNGFVGKATSELSCPEVLVKSYDIRPEQCHPPGLTLKDLLTCQAIFISVPTPMSKDGSCHLNILASVVHDLDSLGYSGYKIIRSTIPVGTSDSLGCYFMPEFLTEANYVEDFRQNPNWIFGLAEGETTSRHENFAHVMLTLFSKAFKFGKVKSNKLTFLKNKEAEMVKMFRNCFLATKVSFCNEIAEFCNLKGIQYENVRQWGAIDTRIQHSHTAVPGPDGKFGFGGTCFPKDTASLSHEMKKAGMKSFIINAAIERNNTKDRPEHDWNDNKGRAVV